MDGVRLTRAPVVTTGEMHGFAGAKAFLEHGIRLDLVRDCFPAGIAE